MVYDRQSNIVVLADSDVGVSLGYEGDARLYSDAHCSSGREFNALTIPGGATATQGFYFQGSSESRISFQFDNTYWNNSIIWDPQSSDIM